VSQSLDSTHGFRRAEFAVDRRYLQTAKISHINIRRLVGEGFSTHCHYAICVCACKVLSSCVIKAKILGMAATIGRTSTRRCSTMRVLICGEFTNDV
jgi:hypothetical protein